MNLSIEERKQMSPVELGSLAIQEPEAGHRIFQLAKDYQIQEIQKLPTLAEKQTRLDTINQLQKVTFDLWKIATQQQQPASYEGLEDTTRCVDCGENCYQIQLHEVSSPSSLELKENNEKHAEYLRRGLEDDLHNLVIAD